MMYNQYPVSMFNQPYFAQQQSLWAQQQEWQRQHEMLAQQEREQQERREQQEHIAKAVHALSDFIREASQIKESYRPQATVEFMAVLGWNVSGGDAR